VKVTNFAPFAPTAAYSTSTNGGSGYFDGNGDYLTLADNSAFGFGTGAYTVEFWLYLDALPGSGKYTLVDFRTASNAQTHTMYVNSSGYLGFFNGGADVTSSSAPMTGGSWTHIAFSRASSTLKIYVNGVEAYSASNSIDYQSSRPVTIGAAVGGLEPIKGYISNFRIVKGTGVYTAAFTPTTTPLTAISGTSLLTNFTNAAIFDNSMKNDLETVGNAQISTSVKKFGTGSMAFDGSGDYLHFEYPVAYFAPTSWTMETFVYFNNLSSDTGLFGYSDMFFIRITSSAIRIEYRHTPSSPAWAVNNTSYTLSTGTWYHFAIVVNNGSMRVYIDGTAIGTATTGIGSGAKGGAGPNKLIVGATDQYTFDSVDSFLNGYMDEVRITSGVARYTSNFTPPTAAFPNK